MTSFSNYSDTFGKPNTGFHSIRFFNIAILDVIVTIIVAVMLANAMKADILFTILFCFLCGILIHRLFAVRTTVDKMLFQTV